MIARSWGGVEARHHVHALRDRTRPLPPSRLSLLPRGAARSYGDSCLNDGGAVLDTRGLDRLIAFDADTGVLRCEAGVLLADIEAFALQRGWFPPVVPGTGMVTVGGAIANDVHGKNHHRAGSFGHHVARLELLRSDGTRRECAPGEPLFHATVGGLGLTGLVTWAELRLKRVPGPWIAQSAHPFTGLGPFFEECEPLEQAHEYVVAWIEADRASPRGITFAGDAVAGSGTPPPARTRSIPVTPPLSLVNRATAGAFNTLYHWRQAGATRTLDCRAFFHPLDGVSDWNRLYGPRGFFQHQAQVPEGEAGRAAIAAVLSHVSRSGHGSFLGVLKRFGTMAPAGMMSFPRPGYTLALDFPNRGAATLALLDSLDAIVREAGGRLYPAKDARMSAATFEASYPEWRAFAAHVDPAFSSSFWRRVTGTAAA